MRFELGDLEIYRRHLPHWRIEHAVYFVTWRLHSARPPLEPAERTIVCDAIEHFNKKRYSLLAYVVMDDHVQVLVSVAEGYTLEKILHSWKSFTAHRLRHNFSCPQTVWQEEYFDRIVRGTGELRRAMEYIANNPAKRWPEIEGYQWMKFFEVEM